MKPFAHTAAAVRTGFLLLAALAVPAWAQIVPQQGCGNENEGPCPVPLEIGLPCDTGLHLQGSTCTNFTRRELSVDQGFIGSWADWALRNQREQLAQDEPLNWVMQIATHNSYNTFGDGHSFFPDFPNQVYSTTDQLRAGARVILFDNYWIGGAARLCHAGFITLAPKQTFGPITIGPINLDPNVICPAYVPNVLYLDPSKQPGCLQDPVTSLCVVHPSMRYYSNGIKEIRNWLEANPNEIVIIDFEEYIPFMHGPDGAILDPIRAYLGDMVLTPPLVPPASVTGSISKALGTDVSQLTVTRVATGRLYLDEHITGPGIPAGTFISLGNTTGGEGTYNLGNIYNHTIPDVPSETITTTTFTGVFPDRWPTRREMLAAGKRVIILDNAFGTPGGFQGSNTDFQFAQNSQPSEFLFSEVGTVAGTYGDGTWFAKKQRFFSDPPITFSDPPATGVTSGCFNTPDFKSDFNKTLFTKATIIVEERELGQLFGTNGHPDLLFGLLRDMNSSPPAPPASNIVSATECNYSLITLDKYSRVLVPSDGADDGKLFDGLPDYLAYTPDPVHHRFGIADFHRQALVVWSWKPDDRGQNGDCAMLEDSSSGRWISANCSDQERLACARPRSHSGKDPLQWQDPLGTDWRVTSAKGSWDAGPSACQAEFGSDFVFSVPVNGYQNTILKGLPLAANDNVWLDYRQLNGDDKWVVDDEPPVMTCTATPSVLWPPNNKMVPVNLNVTAVSALFGQTPFSLKSVTTSEGNAATDIHGFVVGQPSTAGSLLASRLGNEKAGRVYTFVYQSTDQLGLTGTCTAKVLVPHDQGRSSR